MCSRWTVRHLGMEYSSDQSTYQIVNQQQSCLFIILSSGFYIGCSLIYLCRSTFQCKTLFFTGPEASTQHPGDKLRRLFGTVRGSHGYCRNCIRWITNPQGEQVAVPHWKAAAVQWSTSPTHTCQFGYYFCTDLYWRSFFFLFFSLTFLFNDFIWFFSTLDWLLSGAESVVWGDYRGSCSGIGTGGKGQGPAGETGPQWYAHTQAQKERERGQSIFRIHFKSFIFFLVCITFIKRLIRDCFRIICPLLSHCIKHCVLFPHPR